MTISDMRIARRTLIAGAVAGLAAGSAPSIAKGRTIRVAPDGGGDASTLGAALDIAARAGTPATITLAPGIYREKLTVTVPDLTIAGSGPASIVTHGTAAGHLRPDGTRWGTGGSATLTIDAPGVTLRDLTVRNDFDHIDDRRTGASGGAQAVALAIGRGGDRTRARRCGIEGYQDTLLVNARALFDGCRISGSVDFIFGGGAALFDRCAIVTRAVPGAPNGGYLTAPSTPASQPFGLVLDRCRIIREAGVPDGSTWLGRPWRAGGNMDLTGASAFLHCWMDAHIRREGWTWMGYRDPAGTARRLTPPEARLYEFASRGPGAGDAGPDRRLLTPVEARAFTRVAVLGGWPG